MRRLIAIDYKIYDPYKICTICHVPDVCRRVSEFGKCSSTALASMDNYQIEGSVVCIHAVFFSLHIEMETSTQKKYGKKSFFLFFFSFSLAGFLLNDENALFVCVCEHLITFLWIISIDIVKTTHLIRVIRWLGFFPPLVAKILHKNEPLLNENRMLFFLENDEKWRVIAGKMFANFLKTQIKEDEY